MYDYSDDISKYLLKQMNLLQEATFERRLELDPALAAEVARQREMLDIAQAYTAIKEAQADPHYDEVDRITTEILEYREKNPDKRTTWTKKIKEEKSRFKRIEDFVIATLMILADLRHPRASDYTRAERERLGFKVDISEGIGRSIGKRLAKMLAKIRSWFRRK